MLTDMPFDSLSPTRYNFHMKYILETTDVFDKWFSGVRDIGTKRRLLARFALAENGHFGDNKQIDDSLFELRCFFGGGIRVYYTVRNQQIVLLLAGGNKSSQQRDIESAKLILGKLED